MDISLTPKGSSASTTAFITAGGQPIVPNSPQPYAPRVLVLVKVISSALTLKFGGLSALGIV